MAPPSIPIPDIPGLPTKSEPNFGNLLIKGDTLYQKDETLYTSRDLHVRTALFVIVQAVPILSSLILTFSRKAWWKRKWFWTMSRLVVLWLISIQIVAAVVYALQGSTTRMMFLSATLHLQIEYLIIAFLIGASPLTALGVAYIAGFLLLFVQLLVADLSIVYIITTIFGFSDFMIPLLFAYSKQWLYATGGVAHLVQAVAVFAVIVKDYGHTQYAAIAFLSTMIMNGALVTALIRAYKEPRTAIGPIRLSNGEDHGASHENPLAGINIPRNTLIMLFGASVAGSVASAFIFTFVVAGK